MYFAFSYHSHHGADYMSIKVTINGHRFYVSPDVLATVAGRFAQRLRIGNEDAEMNRGGSFYIDDTVLAFIVIDKPPIAITLKQGFSVVKGVKPYILTDDRKIYDLW